MEFLAKLRTFSCWQYSSSVLCSGFLKSSLLFWFLSIPSFEQIRYGTFVRQWNQKWTLVLKFRDQNSFSQCDVCQELKQQLLSLHCILKLFFIVLRVQMFVVDAAPNFQHLIEVSKQRCSYGCSTGSSETISGAFGSTIQ